MLELIEQIPDVNVLLDLAPEELAGKLLFVMRKRMEDPRQRNMGGNGRMFHFSQVEGELWNYNPSGPKRYPTEKREEVNLALSEAWAWLEAQGLLVPAPETNGQNGWRVLSRRARAMESEREFADYRVTRLLPKENLHPRIADVVWGAFVRGEFDSAAFHAMKAVEVAVRAASDLGHGKIGTDLMQEAFAPERGPLTDTDSEKGEQVARMRLFAGAIGSYKNPHSHRDVNLDDPQEALEIIYFANHLLRIVDTRERANVEGST